VTIPQFRPAGPLPDDLYWLRDWIQQAALWKQTRDPSDTTVGDPNEKFITRKEAVTLGVYERKAGGGYTAGPGGGGGTGGGAGGGTTPPPIDLTPPPTPEGLTVTAAFSNIIIRWDQPTYTQGQGHIRTLIYGAVWAADDPTPPVFSEAQLIASATRTNIYAYPTNPSTRWAIWIRWQSIDGGISVVPAGGANGVVATTGVDIDSVIAALTAAAQDPSTPYGVLTLRGDLISVADNAGNVTDLFNLVTTPITVGGMTVAPGLYLRQAFIHNGFITNAMIGRAVIDDAVVATLSAAKFTGGEMRVDSFLASTNYTPGPSGAGFRLNADGTAELMAAYIRGQLTAGQINTNGLTIRDPDGNIILNASGSPTIAGGTVVTGTGGLSLGELATGFENTPIVTLTTTGHIFVTPAGGTTPTPATITLTANAQNIDDPEYEWIMNGVVQASVGSTFVLDAFPPAPDDYRLIRVNVTSGTTSASSFDTMSIYSLQEGSAAYNAGLENESQAIACNSSGTPIPGQLPMVSRLRVVRGAEFITAGVTFSVVDGSVSGLSGVTIDADGVISIANITANFGSATFSAAVAGGPTLLRVFTAIKVLAGQPGANNGDPGPPGPRGTFTAYSTSVDPPIFSAVPWNGAADDLNASRIIWRLLGQSGDPPDNNHLRIGDTVTLRTPGATMAATRFWAGTAWLDPGVVISGNLIVGGTIAGGTNLNVTGYVRTEGGFGVTVPSPLTGLPDAPRLCAGTFNVTLAQDYGLIGGSAQSLGGGAGVYGYNTNSVSGGIGVAGRGLYAVYGNALTGRADAVGVYGVGNSGVGVRGESSTSTAVSGASVAGTGVFGSSSSGTGVKASGPVALQTYGQARLEGTSSSLRLKPNQDSSAGRATVMRTDGGAFLLGRTAEDNADGGTSGSNGLTYVLSTGDMIVDRLAVNNMTVTTGASAASFSGTKPGGATTNVWMLLQINGLNYAVPVWPL
jgi:hypothetical protein